MNRSLLKCLLLCLACLAGLSAHAASLATVEAVQAPAWLERAGRTEPLAAATELRTGDVVRTGTGARAYLMLADGSRVKLGAGASFTLHSRSLQPQKALHGVLNVVAGAFRFTTGAIKRKTATERELTIRVGTATIGIRGTDIWGKASGDRDVVALLAGRIEVTRGGEAVELDEPNTYFDAPRAGNALVRPLDAGQLNAWSRETEILPGDGASMQRGLWRVLAATATSSDEALALYDQLRLAGFAARIRPVKPADAEAEAWHYQLFLAGFVDKREAEVAAARLAALTSLAATASR